MLKGVLIAFVFLFLGFSLNVALPPGLHSATTDVVVESTQRIPFDSYKVYADEVQIAYPGLRYAQVSSDSMAPLITHDSVVFEKVPESSDEVHIGDVISFYEPSVDKTVLHMVIDIVEQDGSSFYRTKGTANPVADPWLVAFVNVKGIMVGTFR